MKIVISPWSQKLPIRNAKNYPWWNELVKMFRDAGHYVIQVGVSGEDLIGADEFIQNAPLSEIKKLIAESDVRMSVDNFFHHLCYAEGKKCYAIFGKSDPLIFGYAFNTNILKDRKYLREKQFDIWHAESYSEEVFVDPQTVFNEVINGN